ncbi:MAG: type II secretion system F family protein [Armatimonadota bacterium]|nr:type II secretion system F family protein [Armatimonadota bacterium]
MSPAVMAALGGALVFTVMYVLLLVLARESRTAERLVRTAGWGEGATESPMQGVVHGRGRSDPMPALSETLEGTQFWEDLQLHVLRAGLLLRPSEALIIAATCTIVGFVAGWLLSGQVMMGVLGSAIGLGAPYCYLAQQARKRQTELTNQLPNVLDMLSSALRSGHALTRGFRIISTQTRPPIAEEFAQVLQDIQVGISVSDALDALLSRTDSYDLELVVTAMQTQLKLGGDLSEVLDNIAEVIRERVRLQGEIDAATSEGRLSATILVAMPIVMVVIIQMINPGYLTPLFQEPAGIVMLLGAGLLTVAGIIIIRGLLEIDF